MRLLSPAFLASVPAAVIATLLAAPLPALAADDPSTTASASLERAEKLCKSAEGEQQLEDGAVTKIDLTGDGVQAVVLDFSRVRCAPGGHTYCGSGGCALEIHTPGGAWRWQAEGWRLVELDGRPLLLLELDGAWCGGAGAQVCYTTLVWSGDALLSPGPEPRQVGGE